jgi:hypothetical protein
MPRIDLVKKIPICGSSRTRQLEIIADKTGRRSPAAS